jgi:hypothetical protein
MLDGQLGFVTLIAMHVSLYADYTTSMEVISTCVVSNQIMMLLSHGFLS